MRPTILVVEDHAPTRDLLRRVLEEEEYAVEIVADGEKAVGALAQRTYDVVVLDIALPKLSGLDVMEYIASTTPRLLESIVVVTGLDAKEIRTLFPTICETLSKPVLPNKLLESVQRCMRPKKQKRTDTSVA